MQKVSPAVPVKLRNFLALKQKISILPEFFLGVLAYCFLKKFSA
jgi:hypothetical protein